MVEERTFKTEFFGHRSGGEKPLFYKKFWHAIQESIYHQFKDRKAALPGSELSQALYDAVHMRLPSSLNNDLRFFESVGQSLDIFHGVEGFFELRFSLVTFTLKEDKNFKKAGGHFEISRKQLEMPNQLNLLAWRMAEALLEKSLVITNPKIMFKIRHR